MSTPTPQTIRRYHVFLASPGDVREHRDFVRAFFADYNIQHAAVKGLEFRVVDWENYATVGVGEPQKLITRQTLAKFRDSLVLVIGILGQRFGTPTSTHESGTEEEFETALGWWKEGGHPEIKWFFLDTERLDVPANRAERANAKVLEQWDKVCAFRERLEKGRAGPSDPPVFYATFQDLESFADRFRRDLNLWLGAPERPWNTPPSPTEGPAEVRRRRSTGRPKRDVAPARRATALLAAYLDRVREETGKISLLGLGQSLRAELDILEAYVPLKAERTGRLIADECELMGRPGELGRGVRDEPPIEVNQVMVRAAEFGLRGVVLLGDPGSGKTTAARQLVHGLASGRVAPDQLGFPAGIAPVFLRFRNLQAADAGAGFNSFLERELAPILEDDPARRRAVRDAVLDHPRLLWVFDGLDEVVEEDLRREARDWVLRLLKQRPHDAFLVTSRFQGYRAKAELGGAFAEFHVQPLEPAQSRDFVRRWYREVCARLLGRGPRAHAEAEELTESLIGLLDGPVFQVGRMPELPANPLLLTILCVVHHQDRNLPRRRADLYARCVRVLLEHWRLEVWKRQGAKPFDAPSAERVLAELAWLMHQEQGRTALDVARLAQVSEPTLLKMPEDAGLGRDGVDFIRRMREQSGVLAMVGGGKCAFLHLTFQEYLAALHAESRMLADELGRQFDQTWWREPILLAMAIGRPEFFAAFLEQVLESGTWRQDPDLLGQCLDEARNPEISPLARWLGDPQLDPEDRLRLLRLVAARSFPELGAVAEQLAGRETGEVRSLASQIVARARGLEVTADLAAPPVAAEKLGAVHLDAQTGIEFAWIPPGEFLMGGKHKYDGKPVHPVRLTRGFWLGRYTVTNKDYRRCIEATGHRTPEYWSRREFNALQQPVVGVDWNDATAYCQWAGCRLPTEAEWEYACRAGSTGGYCLGDGEERLAEFGWYVENSGGTLRPVGQKLPNVWGLYDMHGNVWEWCQDWDGDYPGELVVDPPGPSKGSVRVIRGGSWLNPAGRCRSAVRDWGDPACRDADLGFRVVLARSSVPGLCRPGQAGK